jgi:hypothetical protein
LSGQVETRQEDPCRSQYFESTKKHVVAFAEDVEAQEDAIASPVETMDDRLTEEYMQ